LKTRPDLQPLERMSESERLRSRARKRSSVVAAAVAELVSRVGESHVAASYGTGVDRVHGQRW
jgi:hypothetical protein